jgi:putative intracellular protease/amidase
MKQILCPLPDRDFDVTEVAVPWKLLKRAGHSVIFATESASTPAADPLLLTGVLFGKLGAAPEARTFYSQLLLSPEFQRPLAWESLRTSDYDALLLPGGHAPGMRQYLGSSVLQSKIAEVWNGSQKPVAAICHGVLPLARARDAAGKSVLFDARTTCLTKPMERSAYFLTFWKLGRYYRTYPAYVEDEVKAALRDTSQFQRGPAVLTKRGTEADDSAAFVVEDGRYVSARWPGDAYLFAKKLLDRL